MTAAFARVRRLRAEEARLEARLAKVRIKIRPAESQASKALGYQAIVRGPQLLNAIDRAELADAERAESIAA